MKQKFRGILLATIFAGTALAAYADTVTLSTFYPSPYGSYQNLDTTQETHLATDSAFNAGIGVPAGTVPGAKLDIRSAGINGLSLRRNQNANDTGQYIEFLGGAAGNTSRGYLGYGKTGTGAEIISGRLLTP